MKAEELRLKNLVYVNHKTDRLAFVDSINDSAILCVFVDGMAEDLSTGMIVSPEKLIPVPLTEDLLLRMGFEKNKSKLVTFSIDNWITIIKEPSNEKPESWDFFCRGTYLTCYTYVHEAQNLYYALTGQELTIKE